MNQSRKTPVYTAEFAKKIRKNMTDSIIKIIGVDYNNSCPLRGTGGKVHSDIPGNVHPITSNSVI